MAIAASNDAGLDVSAPAALVGAEIGLVVVGDAFETDKPRRSGAEFAGQADQGGGSPGWNAEMGSGGLFHNVNDGRDSGPRQVVNQKLFCCINGL